MTGYCHTIRASGRGPSSWLRPARAGGEGRYYSFPTDGWTKAIDGAPLALRATVFEPSTPSTPAAGSPAVIWIPDDTPPGEADACPQVARTQPSHYRLLRGG
jgi:hypothetical protein